MCGSVRENDATGPPRDAYIDAGGVARARGELRAAGARGWPARARIYASYSCVKERERERVEGKRLFRGPPRTPDLIFAY